MLKALRSDIGHLHALSTFEPDNERAATLTVRMPGLDFLCSLMVLKHGHIRADVICTQLSGRLE
jgi:hypothetical protein